VVPHIHAYSRSLLLFAKNSISQLPPKAILDYDYGTYKGYFAKNFVAQEFRCAGVDKIQYSPLPVVYSGAFSIVCIN
jgi:hypothetical protein